MFRPLAVAASLVAGAGIVFAANLDPKVGGAIFVAFASVAATTIIGAKRTLLFGLLMSIPLAADINLFYRPNAGSTGGLVVSAADICLLLLLAILLFELASKQAVFKLDRRLVLPALAVLAAGALSLMGSDHLALGWFELFRLAKATLLLLLLPNIVRTEGELKFALAVLMAGLVLQSVLVFTQTTLGTSLGLEILGENPELMSEPLAAARYSRAGGTLLHPNMLANYLNLLLFLGLAVVLVRGLELRLLPLALATAMGVSALVLTLSRGGWIAFVVGYLALAGFVVRRIPERRHVVVLATVAAVFLVVLSIVLPTPVNARLFSDDYGAARLRIPLAQIALQIIDTSPVIGTGINSYPQIVPSFISNNTPELIPGWYDVDNMVVHNLYLLVAAETGILGLGAFLWLMVAIFAAARRVALEQHDWISLVALGMACGLVTFWVAELFDNSYRVGLSLTYLIYAFAGLLARMQLLVERQKAEMS